MQQQQYMTDIAALPSAADEVLNSPSSYFNRPVEDDRKNLTYRIQKEVEQELQPPLKDISYGFAQGLTDMVYTAGANEPFPTRKQALDYFEKEFWTDGIIRTKGNLAKLARESGRSREKLYDKFRDHDIFELVDKARPWKADYLENKLSTGCYLPPNKVEDTLTGVLSGYKSVIHDNIYTDISARIKEKAPVIAEKIAPYVPTPARRLDDIMERTKGITGYREAKAIFEREVIYGALEAAGFDRGKAAEYLDETRDNLNKRMKALGIQVDNVVSMGEFVRNRLERQNTEPHAEQEAEKTEEAAPVGAVNEIERFQQLVREYNAKRDAERERKERTVKQQKFHMKLAA